MDVMDDDFNTPEALAVMFDLAHEINRIRNSDAARAARLGGCLKSLGHVLGLLQDDPERFLQSTDAGRGSVDPEVIEAIIEQRKEARSRKNWVLADQKREELKAMGITLEDGPDGTLWRRDD